MRILIAEDDALAARLVERVLLELGHQVVLTGDGQEAWEAFHKEPFPIVVTDWKMPVLDGLALTRRIRQHRLRSHPWILLLTGVEPDHGFAEALAAGADDVITKPLDRQLLRVRLTVAERMQRMGEQVAALSAALPICLHCKLERDAGEHWPHVEDLVRGADYGHGYCADCYYEQNLLPELLRMRAHASALPIEHDATLDSHVLAGLAAFEEDSSPGLLGELIAGFHAAAGSARGDLDAYARSGLLDEDAEARLHRFRNRGADLGAGRLVSRLDRLFTLGPEDRLDRHVELGPPLLGELEDTLAALGAACTTDVHAGPAGPAVPAVPA